MSPCLARASQHRARTFAKESWVWITMVASPTSPISVGRNRLPDHVDVPTVLPREPLLGVGLVAPGDVLREGV